MALSPQKQIQAGRIGILNFSSPAAITFKGDLYVFYNGFGNDGIWYTWMYNAPIVGEGWARPIQCKRRGAGEQKLADNTGPSPIVYNNTLYVFYNGEDGSTWVISSSDGSRWTKPQSVTGQLKSSSKVAASTSPCVVVGKDRIWLFWIVPSEDPNERYVNRIQHAVFDGRNWTDARVVPAPDLGVRLAATAAVVSFHGNLYLFYDGSGGDGTWVTIYNFDKWAQPLSFAAYLGGMAYWDGVSPSAFVSEGEKELTVMNGGPDDGLWFSKSTSGVTWDPPTNVRKIIGTQGLMKGSSPSGIFFKGRAYIFWTGPGEAGLWFTRGAKQTKSLGEMAETPSAGAMMDAKTASDFHPATISDDMLKQGFAEAGGLYQPYVGNTRLQRARVFWESNAGKISKVVATLIALAIMALFFGLVTMRCQH